MNKIGYVNAMYPNAKFVFIVRSIYGQSSSMKMHFERYLSKKGVIGLLPNNDHDCWSIINKDDAHEIYKNRCYPGNFNLIPEAWMRLNKLALSELEQLDDDRYIIISYENLVLEQYNVLKRVFDFLDLDKKHRAKEEKLFNRSRKLMNNHTGNPLSNWEQYLSKEQIESIYKVIEANQEEYTKIQKSLIPSAREKWKSDVNLSLKVVA